HSLNEGEAVALFGLISDCERVGGMVPTGSMVAAVCYVSPSLVASFGAPDLPSMIAASGTIAGTIAAALILLYLAFITGVAVYGAREMSKVGFPWRFIGGLAWRSYLGRQINEVIDDACRQFAQKG
ncbi:hypothetical protein C3E98_032755, partial [Pseudomonas sp. MWU13-2625]